MVSKRSGIIGVCASKLGERCVADSDCKGGVQEKWSKCKMCGGRCTIIEVKNMK